MQDRKIQQTQLIISGVNKGTIDSIHRQIRLLLILLMTAGCNRRSAVDEKMDLADSLMTSRPDSALAILEGIPALDVKGERNISQICVAQINGVG